MHCIALSSSAPTNRSHVIFCASTNKSHVISCALLHGYGGQWLSWLCVVFLLLQDCQLGQHVPLEKDVGGEGIVFAATSLAVETPTQSSSPPEPTSGDQKPPATNTDDPNTCKRHGRCSSRHLLTQHIGPLVCIIVCNLV